MSSIPLPALSIRPPQEPDLGANVDRLIALKSMLGQQQLQSVQIQQAQQQLQDRQTLQTIAPQYVKKNDQGQPTGFDYDGFSADAQEKGVSPATMSQLATMQKTNADNLKARADAGQTTLQTQDKLLGDAYNHMEGIRGETDPQKRQANWQSALNWAQQSQIQGAQSLPSQAPDDKTLNTIEAQLGMHAQAVADVKNQTDIQKTRAETTEAQNKGEESASATAKNNAEALWYQQHPEAGAPGVPTETASAADWLAKPENKGKTLSDYNIAMKKIVPAYNFQLQGGAGGGLNQNALDQAAQRYAQTGELPSMGMGAASAIAPTQIMNRAGELYPTGSIAQNSAEYKANQESLKGLQKNFDQVTAFENTAGKNLDQFLTTAQKVVDSGSPWINSPLRNVNQGMLGSSDQAAFNAARQTALTEIAKVLNSSNASGVLSDSARGEVSQLIGPNATLKQIVSAANILKQDMGNRHQAYQEQIADIQGRLKPQGTQRDSNSQQAGGGQKTGTAPAVGQTVTIKGRQMKVTAVHPDGSFDAN